MRLVLTAADGLVKAIAAAGGKKYKTVHASTDHGWSDHRIALESTILTWLSSLQ